MLSAIAFATVFVWSLSHVHLAVVFLATSLVLEYLVQARTRRGESENNRPQADPCHLSPLRPSTHGGTPVARSQQRVADMLAPALVHSVRSAEDTE